MAGGNVPAQLAPIFQAAGAANHIPPEVLAGISSVESNIFRNTGPSSAGAVGGMQFEPGTARSLGINPNDPRSAIFGAAKLLNQYGYQQNPMRAIGAYNGGPGNPQMGYAQQVMSEAARLKGQLGPGGSTTGLGSAGATTVQVPGFDTAGFNQAQGRYLAGSFVSQNDKSNPFDIPVKGAVNFSDPLLTSGALTTKPPNAANYLTTAHQSLQGLAGTPLSLHPALRGGTVAGGFLPKNAQYIPGRKDQGRDGQTNPGGPILADGNGVVVNVLADPNGFGPRYPVVRFTSGPYAGRTLYFGHTLAAVKPGQQIQDGQVLSYTGKGPGGVGNATVPGWFEIGYANSGSPGPLGQSAPF